MGVAQFRRAVAVLVAALTWSSVLIGNEAADAAAAPAAVRRPASVLESGRPRYEIAGRPPRVQREQPPKPEAVDLTDEGPGVVEELTTETSETVVEEDGSVTQIVSAAPVRFRGDGGEWRDIDIAVVTESDGGLRAAALPVAAEVRVTDGEPRVELPTDVGVVTMFEPDHQVVDRPGRGRGGPNGSAAAEATADVPGQARLAVDGGRELHYQFLPTGVKEDIVLASPASGSTFDVSFAMPPGTTAREVDGRIEFVAPNDDVIATYSGGLATDAVARATVGEVAPDGTTTDVVVSLDSGAAGVVAARVSIDEGWLADPARAFPVAIDPYFQVGSAPGLGDIYLNSDNPTGLWPTGGDEAGKAYVQQNHLRIGSKLANGHHAQTYLPFAGLAPIAGHNYVSAQLRMYRILSGTCAATGQVRTITSSWNPSTVTWNTRPSVAGSAPDGSTSLRTTDGLQTFDVTGAVAPRFSGGAWYGLSVLSDNTTTNCGWREFRSTDAGFQVPELAVTWWAPDEPPPTTTTTEAPPTTTTTSTTTTTTTTLPPPSPQSSRTSPRHYGAKPSQPAVADPVNAATGNLVDTFTDLGTPDQVAGLGWERTYNLFDTAVGELGRGWTHSLSPSMTVVAGGMEMTDADGRHVVWLGSGSSFARESEYPADLAAVSGGHRVTFDDGASWDFDGAGRLQTITDPLGRSITATRDGSGRLTTAVSSQGPQLTFVYGTSGNEAGKITSVTGPAGTVGYGYDASGNLTAVTDVRTKTTTYAYDSSNRLTSITDPTGVVAVANTFDGQGRVATQTRPQGAATTFTYGVDATSGWTTTAVTDSVTGSAGVVTYYFDDAFRIRRISDNLPKPGGGTGNEAAFSYDSAGNRIASISRLGGQRTFAYDSKNRLTCEAAPGGTCPTGASLASGGGSYEAWHFDPQGRVDVLYSTGEGTSTFTYSGSNRMPASATDGNGNTTMFTYASGLLTGIVDPDGVATAFTHDATGRIVSSTEVGVTSTYAFDSAGRLRCVAEPTGTCPNSSGTGGSGPYTSATFTGDGLLATVRNPDGGTSTYEYDDAGRVVTATDPTGAVTTYHYDAITGVLESVDIPGAIVDSVVTHNTWTYAHDATGNVVCEAAPGGECPTSSGGGTHPFTTFTYGPLGRLLSETNALGQTTSYAYDPDGNIVEIEHPDGGSEVTVYDAAGRVIESTDAAGINTELFYDAAGRVSCIAGPGGDCIAGTGPIASSTYSPVGDLLTDTDAAGAITTYAYTDGGRDRTITDPASGTTTFTYDTTGRLWKETNAFGAITTLAYNARGLLQSETSPTGLVDALTYDAGGNLATVTDPAGVVTAHTWTLRGELATVQTGTQGTVAYAYNADGTIRTVTDALDRATSYTYDTRGNRLTRTNALGKTETWTYDDDDKELAYADQLNRETTTTYWNDPTNGIKTQTEDASGRTATTTFNSDGAINAAAYQNGPTYTHGYDALRNTTTIDDGTNTWNNTYDTIGRLTATEHNPATSGDTEYGHNAVGQTTEVDDVEYTYDGVGRLQQVVDTETLVGGGLGLFVAVGSLGKVRTSPDGVTWTARTSGFSTAATGFVQAVEWSPDAGLFVAVNRLNQVATSPDGITWTQRTPGVSGDFRAVAWSPELSLFVVVGGACCTSPRLITSPDGITWTSRTTGLNSSLQDVVWSSEVGLFVAVGMEGKLLTSADGITWTQRTSGFGNARLEAVTWSASLGKFAVSGEAMTVATSPDGITWTHHSHTLAKMWELIWVDDLGVFVAAAGTSGIGTSSDGIAWTAHSTGFGSNETRGVEWADDLDLLIAAGDAGKMATSTDGNTWTARTSGFGSTDSIFAVSRKPGVTTTTVATRTQQYDDANQLCWTAPVATSNTCSSPPSGATTYTYDDAGRRLTAYTSSTDNVTYTYDASGQLATVVQVTATGTTTQTRSYDGDGLLSGVANSGASSGSWHFAWDKSLDVPQLVSISSGSSTTELVYGADGWVGARTPTGFVNIGQDVFGNVIPTTGTPNLARSATYDPWGVPTGPSTLEPRLGYRGELTLGGLVYLRARDYDPKTGQFLTPDPLDGVDGATTLGQGFSYSYADNDPIHHIDPLGLQSSDRDFDRAQAREQRRVERDRERDLRRWNRAVGSNLRRAHAALRFIADLTGIDCFTVKATFANCTTFALTFGSGPLLKVGSAVALKVGALLTSGKFARVAGLIGEALVPSRIRASISSLVSAVRTASSYASRALDGGRSLWNKASGFVGGLIGQTQSGWGKVGGWVSGLLTRSRADDVIVLGKWPRYERLANRLGARYFNVPGWVWKGMSETAQWAANERFLLRAIDRGARIRLASRLTTRNLTGFYAREITFLMKLGYVPSRNGRWMLPPR